MAANICFDKVGFAHASCELRHVVSHQKHLLQGVEAAVAVMRPLCVRAKGDDYMLEVSITRLLSKTLLRSPDFVTQVLQDMATRLVEITNELVSLGFPIYCTHLAPFCMYIFGHFV